MTILLVPAVWFRSERLRPLHTLLFFPAALAAFLVLFYLVHALNVLLPFVHAALGYYRPRYVDALLSLLWFVVLALGVLVVNLVARAFVDPLANYMYMFDPEAAGILVVLWDLIRIPLLYELPLLPLLAPVLLAMVAAQRALEHLVGGTRGRGSQRERGPSESSVRSPASDRGEAADPRTVDFPS